MMLTLKNLSRQTVGAIHQVPAGRLWGFAGSCPPFAAVSRYSFRKRRWY